MASVSGELSSVFCSSCLFFKLSENLGDYADYTAAHTTPLLLSSLLRILENKYNVVPAKKHDHFVK